MVSYMVRKYKCLDTTPASETTKYEIAKFEKYYKKNF